VVTHNGENHKHDGRRAELAQTERRARQPRPNRYKQMPSRFKLPQLVPQQILLPVQCTLHEPQ
jgi:hypothetical protein